MSAAAALPYPNGSNGSPSKGTSSNGNNSAEKAFNTGPSTAEQSFPHISRLQAEARRGFDPHRSIPYLLDTADAGLNKAASLANFSRRPDLAFVEFLRSSEIVLNIVPRHKDYVHFTVDQPERAIRLGVLAKKVGAETERFEKIKEIIVNNNKRLGTRPEEIERRSGDEGEGHNGYAHESVNGLGHQGLNGHTAGLGPKMKPNPSPKPERLHGHAVSHSIAGVMAANGSNAGVDLLTERFAKIRGLGANTALRPDSQASNAPSSNISDVDTNLPRTTSTNALPRPQGPRGMPNTHGGPALPAKLPLYTHDIAMPKEPEATYSPARNMHTTGDIAAPRHSARSLASNPSRRSSLMAAASNNTQIPNGSHPGGDYFSAPHSIRPASNARRMSSATSMPMETRMGAERLFDYLKRYEILLIDFRPRETFDQGHILASNVICIDPVSVREGMSAEQVGDSLVLNPDNELAMFHNREQYQLVVYCDQDTQSESFLTRPTTEAQRKLKYLHEALGEFNQEKPLKRAPVLLIGGIDAWENLVGPQALILSNTLALMKTPGQANQRRPRPPLAPTVDGGSMRRRTARELNPLNEDEERSWRERLREESVILQPTPALEGVPEGDGSAEGTDGNDEEPNSAIEEFIARFPDAGNLDRQAFAGVMPVRPAPEPPAKVPLYPPTSPASIYPAYSAPSGLSQETAASYPGPSVPARPAPAAPRMSYTGVGDRAGSTHTPAPRTSASQMIPYIPPKYLQTHLRLPKTGLVNFGNTCYMNSILQALSATTPLSIFFLDDAYKAQLQPDNWKVNSKGVLAELYSNLIRNLWKNDVEALRPTTFRRFCGRMSEVWKSDGEQQDAKEFLEFLLDGLHEDLNTTWNRTPLRALSAQEEAKREAMPKLLVAKTEWGRYTHRDYSFVNSLFGGQHASRLQCRSCGFTSTTYEAFTSLSVEIPTDARLYSGEGGRVPTLQDCLRSYCSEEYLTRDDQWHCPRCKMTREASKRITLTRAPQFLVVHFKRFSTGSSTTVPNGTNGNSGGGARKVRIPVDFPLHGLDLAPYMLPPPSQEEAARMARDFGAEALRTEPSMTPPYLYDAYAVVRHIGTTMQSGHYVTAVKAASSAGPNGKGEERWRMFNDSRVGDFDPQTLGRGRELQSEEAYIVFYQRVQGGAREMAGKI